MDFNINGECELNQTEQETVINGIVVKDERPHGKWIFEKADNESTEGYICSNCGRSFHTKVPYFSEFNYCPTCGAQMDKGGNV